MPETSAKTKYARLSSEDRRASMIEAGLVCMARGGIQGFTVDRICAEAGITRGLIAHHFGSINGLLAAVYAHVYRTDMPDPAAFSTPEARVLGLIEATFAPRVFNRDSLNIWVALWGQISVNEELGAEHRRQYAQYLQAVEGALAGLAAARGRPRPDEGVAKGLICLIDGLGLQHCLDPEVMPAEQARAICAAYLAPHLGPLTGVPGL
jgi:TetR/AcrR family transcriptional repressor of bet genes